MSDSQDKAKVGGRQNYWRQLDVFNPEAFYDEVHIIGVGATGSWIAYLLAKMGVKKLHIWDHDTVDDHNCPNQIYGRQDIGQPKVLVLARRLQDDCGTIMIPHQERVDGSQKLKGIVYMCPDKMSSRKEIWTKAIKLNLDVKLLVETRLGAEFGQIHTVRPLNRADIKGFEDTLFSDGEGEASACTNRAIATTVCLIAAAAAHKLVKFSRGEEIFPVVEAVESDKHSSYEMMCIRPIILTTNNWK